MESRGTTGVWGFDSRRGPFFFLPMEGYNDLFICFMNLSSIIPAGICPTRVLPQTAFNNCLGVLKSRMNTLDMHSLYVVSSLQHGEDKTM